MAIQDGSEAQPKPRGFNAHEMTASDQVPPLAEEAQEPPPEDQ